MNFYQVDVTGCPSDNVRVVRALRTIGGLSLKTANDIYVYLQNHKTTTVVAGVGKDVADAIARNLKEAGVTSTVSICSVVSPMLLNSIAGHIFSWEKPARLVRQNIDAASPRGT